MDRFSSYLAAAVLIFGLAFVGLRWGLVQAQAPAPERIAPGEPEAVPVPLEGRMAQSFAAPPEFTGLLPATAVDKETLQLQASYAKANRRSMELAQKYREARDKADNATLETLKTDVRAALAEAFAARQAVQKHELGKLQSRLKAVEASLEKREAAKEQVIDRRMGDLLDTDSDLRWDEAEGGDMQGAGLVQARRTTVPRVVYEEVEENVPGQPTRKVRKPRTVYESVEEPIGAYGTSKVIRRPVPGRYPTAARPTLEVAPPHAVPREAEPAAAEPQLPAIEPAKPVPADVPQKPGEPPAATAEPVPGPAQPVPAEVPQKQGEPPAAAGPQPAGTRSAGLSRTDILAALHDLRRSELELEKVSQANERLPNSFQAVEVKQREADVAYRRDLLEALKDEHNVRLKLLELARRKAAVMAERIGAKLKDAEKLLESKAISTTDYDSLRLEFDVAQLELEQASLQLQQHGVLAELFTRRDRGLKPLADLRGPDQKAPADQEISDEVWKAWGLRLAAIAPNPEAKTTLVVTEVRADSPAAKAGIQKDDVVFGLAEWEVNSFPHLAFVATRDEVRDAGIVRFHLKRGDKTIETNLKWDRPASR